MLYDPPINEGAHLFYWIIAVLVGFGAAVSFVDSRKVKKNAPKPKEDKS